MADTTASRRRTRRAGAAGAKKAAGRRSSSNARFIAIAALLGIASVSIGLAYLQPALLTDALAPLWDFAGPWLIAVPVIVIGTYVVLRIVGFGVGRVWRWAGAALVATAAVFTIFHLFNVSEIGGVSSGSAYSDYLAGLSSLAIAGILALLVVMTLVLLSPIGVFRASKASGRAAGAAGAGAAAAAGRGIQNVRSRPTPQTSAGDEQDATPNLSDPPIPPSRIVMPEPEPTAKRPTYPEPVGVVRDQQRRLQEEREASRPDKGDSNIGEEQTPRIVMSHSYSGDVTDADAVPSNIPPPGMSAMPSPPLTHDTDQEPTPEAQDLDVQAPDAASDDVTAADVEGIGTPEPGTVIVTEDSANGSDDDADSVEEWHSDTVVMESDDNEVESTAEEQPAESVTTGRATIVDARSDEELVDSLDPFAGLPSVAWDFPSFTLFEDQPPADVDTESHLETADAIQETLQEYGIEVEVTEIRPGPTVTLYGVRPGWDRQYRTVRERNEDGQIVPRRKEVGRKRVKVDAISKLDDDLALQLKAASVRIETITGTNLVGVEVPNITPETVFMRPQLESEAWRKAHAKSKLAFPLGKGSGGEPVVADLARMPHLLVAGSTGSGKSVFVNSLITSLISRATPEELRFVMIDPKRVELTIYNGIPHLITPVIVDTQKVVNALQWMVQQMEQRLELLAQEGARDIASYNEKVGTARHMPYLVLIVDELADLMMTAGKAVENGLVRLAQMGRATGIHLVVATQRPSVNVITGLIKANFPTRISFMVTSLVDSRTILDGAGAEKLLGRGDMLYLPQDASRPIRIQSAFISGHESDAVVDAWRVQTGGYVPPELPELVQPEDIGLQSRGRNGTDGMADGNGSRRGGAGSDDIMEQARELADIYNGKVSTSLLQRRLGIGYPRAARLRDRLVEEGLAGAEIPNAPAETAGRGARRVREAAEEREAVEVADD